MGAKGCIWWQKGREERRRGNATMAMARFPREAWTYPSSSTQLQGQSQKTQRQLCHSMCLVLARTCILTNGLLRMHGDGRARSSMSWQLVKNVSIIDAAKNAVEMTREASFQYFGVTVGPYQSSWVSADTHSHIVHDPSLPPEATRRPSLLQAALMSRFSKPAEAPTSVRCSRTLPLCPGGGSGAKGCTSHTRTVLSIDDDSKCDPEGDNASEVIVPVWPRKENT